MAFITSLSLIRLQLGAETWKIEITLLVLHFLTLSVVLSPHPLLDFPCEGEIFIFFRCKLCISKLLVSELDKTHMGIFTPTFKQCGCNDEKHWKFFHHRQIKNGEIQNKVHLWMIYQLLQSNVYESLELHPELLVSSLISIKIT